MPFTFVQPRKLDMSEINPYAGGFDQGLNTYQNILKTAFSKPAFQQALLKTQLENQYYGRDKESQIALREAQKALAGAQIQSAQSLAAKRKFIQNALSQILNKGALGGNNVQNMPSLPQQNTISSPQHLSALQSILQGGEPTPQNQSSQMGMAFQQQPLQQSQFSQPTNTGLSYPEATLATKELFGQQPKFIEVNGQHLAVTPFGNIPIAKGLTEEEKAAQRGFGAYKSKLYGEAIESFKGYQNQGVALDELLNIVENNTQFRNVAGRIKMPLTNWFGTPEQKELLGRLQSSSGEIALQIAPALKGSFTGRDQTLINSIKAHPTDFPDVFIGKLKAQKLINTVLSDRSKYMAQFLEKGASPLQATEESARLTPLSKYRDEINKLTTHHRNRLISSSFGEDESTKNLSNEELMQIMRGSP